MPKANSLTFIWNKLTICFFILSSKNTLFNSAVELKRVTTSYLPIKKNPFIAFEISDKTAKNDQNYRKDRKEYVAYVEPSIYVMSIANWGTQSTTGNSFTLRSTSSDNIEPETKHLVTVSLFVQMNQCLFI